jgi:hypothetical protein
VKEATAMHFIKEDEEEEKEDPNERLHRNPKGTGPFDEENCDT